jgi:hypothetical protein
VNVEDVMKNDMKNIEIILNELSHISIADVSGTTKRLALKYLNKVLKDALMRIKG